MTTQTRRRIIWGTVIAIALLLLIMAMAPRPVPVDLATVESRDLEVTIEHEGVTRVRDSYVVAAPVAGRMLRIELEPGDPVEAGRTVLATFAPASPTALDARSRAEAEAAVGAARSRVEQAEAKRASTRAQKDFTMIELERYRRLHDSGVVSAEMVEMVEAAALSMVGSLAETEAGIRSAAHELETASARLIEPAAQGSQPGSGVLRLLAPVNGVVLRRLQHSEAPVGTGEPLLEVADPSNLEIVADFLSSDAVRILSGMSVHIDGWGGESSLAGLVRRVEPAGFMKISALGVEEQRVNVIIDFADPREAWARLGDAYRVEVRIVAWHGEDVVSVPTSSLFRHADGWAVFAVRGRKARLTPVEIGHRNGLSAQVVDGLEVGDVVIAHPSDAVSDGVRVTRREL